ncbi:unnamed protein product, partial [Polarella glacialis]
MSTVRLDEEDLDDEDRAILREVSRKGYYHNRPPSTETAAPQKIEAARVPLAVAPAATNNRHQFDAFQKKWDKFDNDDYVKDLERNTLKAAQGKGSKKAPGSSAAAST